MAGPVSTATRTLPTGSPKAPRQARVPGMENSRANPGAIGPSTTDRSLRQRKGGEGSAARRAGPAHRVSSAVGDGPVRSALHLLYADGFQGLRGARTLADIR